MVNFLELLSLRLRLPPSPLHAQACHSRHRPEPCCAAALQQAAPADSALWPCSAAAALCCSSVAMQTGSPTILCWPRSRSEHYTEQYQAALRYLWHFARHKTTQNITITAFLVTCDSHKEHRKPGRRHMIVERRCSKVGFKNGF